MGWVRRLAQRLVRDHHLVDDLVQDTWVAALEGAPTEAGSLGRPRAWLATVMRNLVRQRVRGDGRRRVREARCSRSEVVDSTAYLVERISVQRRVAELVLELPEPYRGAILLRFFEELPPREIARRLGAPLATVNSRLQRGLRILRRRLQDDLGDGAQGGERWIAALAPLLAPGDLARGVPGPIGLPKGALAALPTSAKLLAATLLLMSGGFAAWNRSAEAAPLATPSQAARALAPATALEDVAECGPLERKVVAAPRVAMEPRAGSDVFDADASALASVRVRVLDSRGDPLAGFAVRSGERGDIVGRTGADGWLGLRTPREEEHFLASDERWATLHAGSWNRDATYRPVLVVAPAVRLQGRVTDERGRPLVGARIDWVAPAEFLACFSDILDASVPRGFAARSDGQGKFDLAGAPGLADGRVRVSLAGYETLELDGSTHDQLGLELILSRPGLDDEPALRGLVVDSTGSPIAGAHVGFDGASVLSDTAGEFRLALPRMPGADREEPGQGGHASRVTAIAPGYLPAVATRPEEAWTTALVLRLPERAHTLRGTLVDSAGQPLAGARVWLADPTPGPVIEGAPTTFEGLSAGVLPPSLDHGPASPLSSLTVDQRTGDSIVDFTEGDAKPSALWNWVRSDEAGRFELPGLAPRAYRLHVMEEGSLALVTSEPIAPGPERARIRIAGLGRSARENAAAWGAVAGRLVDEHGRAVEGATCRAFRKVAQVQAMAGAQSSMVTLTAAGARTRTDEDGRFHFERLPHGGVSLGFEADGIVPLHIELSEQADPSQLRLEARSRYHVEVVVDPGRLTVRSAATLAESPDELMVLDAERNPLEMMILTRGKVDAYLHVPLPAERTGVFSVPAGASALGLLRAGELVEVVPIELRRGEVNRIEL